MIYQQQTAEADADAMKPATLPAGSLLSCYFAVVVVAMEADSEVTPAAVASSGFC